MKSDEKLPQRVLVTGGSGFIGTNLIESLLSAGIIVQGLDIKPPQNAAHVEFFAQCNILDYPRLESVFAEFGPDAVVHLAARTDLIENAGLKAYVSNIDGVENIVRAINRTPSVQRALFASTKLVNRNGAITPQTTTYSPDTLYGQSKVLGEQIVRDSPPHCSWTILRPTSIWGPWFGAPYHQFFTAVIKRTYFHMAGCDLPKRFGYVGNAVAQIRAILDCTHEWVNGETFYLADYDVTTIRQWADEINLQIRGRQNLSAPYWMVSLAARMGDLSKKMGISEPPLSSFRLRNLQTPTADVPLDNTMRVLRELPFTQKDGVRQTLQWLAHERNGSTDRDSKHWPISHAKH